MIIYRTQVINGAATAVEVADVPVTAKAVHKATLMKEDFIKLVFDSDVDYKFKAGDWVELDSMPYILADDYFPSMKDEATFSYELQFNAPWYNLYTTMFLFNTYANGVIVKRESDWYITDTAQNILSLIIRTTQDADRNCPCVFNDVLDCEPTVVKTFTFSSTSILSALNNLAKEFELEWWVTYEGGEYYLHFGECDNSITRDANGAVTFDGSTNVRVRNSALAVELTSGENVTKPSVSQKEGLKKKYYVFGSSRNIDQNAVQDMEAGFVTSIVTKRLELAGNPQVMPEGSGEEVVIFDDIYPRSDYQISGVTPVEIITDEVIAYDEQGNPSEYKRYNVYNLQIEGFSDYIFSLIQNDPNVQNVEDIIASGKPLSLKFITKEMGGQTHTPLLAGFEFELSATLVTDENTGNSWYEFQIQHQDINGYIIPNDNLIPQTGDWVCIFNVKGKYIGGTGSNDGQADLRAAFNKWYANKKRDVSYTIKPYANEDIDLNIGDAVVFNYKDNSVTSRVYSYEKTLDIVLAGLGCSDASYTISSYAKTGSVNQLKEDVKVLTASIANGTAGGSMDASAVQNAIATYGRRLFLSKTTEDKADGHITFKEGITSKKNVNLEGGATFGTFESGFLGSGAMIDQYGNAEVKSLYAREFISTPEFRFNRITVTEGEQWNTNAFGIIEDVRVINSKNCIVLHLEDGDLPSVKYGDLCRGIYSNIGYSQENNATPYDLTDHDANELDDCNFPTKIGFFTSYFMATDDPTYYTDEDGKKHWYFPFITKSQQSGSDSTPLPCKNMKFAQYGNPYNSDRQSSFYQTSIRHSYIQQLEHVDSWEIHPWNIASRYGYLDDLTVTLKNSDGSTYNTTLQGNGLYVQDNVYFGNATIQLDPVTIEDIKNQLANYSVQLSAYTDVIKVDDAGNVIDGLWTDTGEAPNISRQYRIFSVITARNGITPLTIEENDVPCGKGKFKVYMQPYGCSCKLENSTLYITHIDNVKDGIAGTEDDVNFDYDACRAMERVWVDLRVECEGVGSILATMPITIKHDPVPYIIADLTNENASVSWSSDEERYIGLPVETYVNMAKGNEDLKIDGLVVNTINGLVPIWSSYQWNSAENAYVYEEEVDYFHPSPTAGWRILITPQYMAETSHAPAVGDEDNPLAALIRVVKMPINAPSITEILFTCNTEYAGVRYERTLSLHIARFADVAIWDIIPTHRSVSVDRNAFFNYPYVGVNIFCTDKSGRRAVTTLPSGFLLQYKISEVVSSFTPVLNPTGNPSEQGWFEIDRAYDAEVEFLQSSGTQYIDTGVMGHQNIRIEAKIKTLVLSGTMYAYGCRGDNSHSITFCLGNNANCRFGSQTILYAASGDTVYEVAQDKTKIRINGVDYNYGAVSDFNTPASLYLMYASYDNSSYYFSGNVYYMKIWNGDVLVRDFIPVRVGQVGYMFDMVSRQLFGNIGTGSFTIGNDVTNGAQANEEYIKTTDTSVQAGKTYYVHSYASVDSAPVAISDPTTEVRVNDPSYADTIKSIIFTLLDESNNVADEEEVLVIREGIGGQGSTGPAGNGVQQVTDYYLRAKDGFTPHYPDPLGYIPEGTDAALVETAQGYPSGWRANTYTPPVKEWPNVWHFTKYDYTSSPDYDTPPSLITTYSEDGNNIVGIHTYYLRTNEDNVNNLLRLDQGGTGWLLDTFVEPDNSNENGHGRFVWRYFAFQYSKEVNGSYYMYSPIEFVAKFVEDGTSFQCAYKVFPTQVNGSDYRPYLDSVSTGADMPKTNNSSWSDSTNGLVVGDGYALWMTQRTYKGATYNNWGDPVRISGHKGETGADGTDIEFIYKLSNDGNPTSAEKPTYDYDEVHDTYWQATIEGIVYKFDSDDFNPSDVPNATGSNLGWTDNPSGVDKDHKYEWVCQRTKKKGSAHWGGWVGPFVWSAYGDTGMDGDGVEYVFIRQEKKPVKPHGPAFSFQGGSTSWDGKVYEISEGVWRPEGWTGGNFTSWLHGDYNPQGEWIPHTQGLQGQQVINEQWTDNPSGVSGDNPVEWVSVRKRINGKWHDFSDPAVWATYSETPNIRIVGGYWYLGDDYLRDDKGNPVKAEGQDGTGIALKDRVSTFNDLLAITPVPKKGDCYVVTTTRHLWVYIGDEAANHTIVASDWQDMGEFQGAAGANSQLHFAWARSIHVHRDQEGKIDGISEFITDYEELDPNVDYEWMGIATTNSVDNPTKKDPSEWDAYKWNHVKGRDGEFFERIYMTTSKYVAPVVSNYDNSSSAAQSPEFLPYVGNGSDCGASYYQFYDDPMGDNIESGTPHYETYPYEWMLERKKVDGVWQPFSTASLWARHGKDGEGVTRVDTYYLKTTMSVGVTYSTQGWVANTYQTPDIDKPYVWRYSASYVGQNLVGRTACELIAVYNSTPNVNLLDDTAFSSDAAMEAWTLKGYVSGDPTADPKNANYNSQQFNNFFGVTTGTQGYNAYYGRFKGTAASGSYIILLEQNIIDERVNKVEFGKWYTLSYWVKGSTSSRFSVSIYGQKYVSGGSPLVCELVDTTEGMYVNGNLVKNTHSQQFTQGSSTQWRSFSTEWSKHTITFKTVDSIDADRCFVHWQMFNTTSVHEVYICMPKLEVGMVATTYSNGQTSTKVFPRTGEWEVGKQYFAGNFGEPYIDAVHSGVNNFGYPAWYRCIRTHVSSDENSPTSANSRLYWDAGSWDGFLATGLFLAQEAYIENLVAKILRTGEPLLPHVEMEGSMVRFFGNDGMLSIELATDLDGVGVLRFYDASGNAMYDLGPQGITNQVQTEATRYANFLVFKISSQTTIGDLLRVVSGDVVPLETASFAVRYELHEGYARVAGVVKYNISENSRPSTWNMRLYKNNSYTDSMFKEAVVETFTNFMEDGWYIDPNCGPNIDLGSDWATMEFHKYQNGKITSIKVLKFSRSEVVSNQQQAYCYDETGTRSETIIGLLD